MTHIRVIVNGEKQMDSDVGEWTQGPPPVVQRHTGAPDPWSRPLLQVFTDAVVRGQDTRIAVISGAHGWTMSVSQPGTHG